METNQDHEMGIIFSKIIKLISLNALLVITLLGLAFLFRFDPDFLSRFGNKAKVSAPGTTETPPAGLPAEKMWQAPDLASLPASAETEKIKYGRELVAHTAKYLGPEGSVMQISNGMNCQNCHLEAGTKTFGNNYAVVASTYPKFRARSGTEEDLPKRVNDCFERSLNGKPLEKDSEEMLALVAYINWVGKDVAKGEKPKGAGLIELPLLDRAADPIKGQALYVQKCQNCHGAEGEGMKQAGNPEYQFPPLWGQHSYNNGAGLYRISTFARYVKANMPLGASYKNPILTDEEAWDLAAFVNSMARPEKDLSNDWPDISAKPFDHPFGPFADNLPVAQHKYGPYQPIIEAKKRVQ
ncbi:MAG TPA: c-type cytochrome [Adhaeribacter sp.]|nr:c-type cytochrome [Adhaeribacter sp.]